MSIRSLCRWISFPTPVSSITSAIREQSTCHCNAKRVLYRPTRYARGSTTPVLGLYSATSLIPRWQHVITLNRRYGAQYPDRYILLRFEDLTEPRACVMRLCAHVGIEFSEDMLDQVILNSSFASRGASKGFDPAVVDRWRLHMSPLTRRWFATLRARATGIWLCPEDRSARTVVDRNGSLDGKITRASQDHGRATHSSGGPLV